VGTTTTPNSTLSEQDQPDRYQNRQIGARQSAPILAAKPQTESAGPAIPSKCGHLRIVDSCNFAHLSDYRTPVHLCRPGVAWCAGSGGHRTRRAPGGAGWACPLFLPPWGRRRLSAQGQASRVRVPGSLTVRGCPAVTAGLDVEGRPRTLARRVPRPERGSLLIKGERRRSRLPPALGRAAAGRAHAAALRSAASACSYATGLILPSAECLRW